MCLLGVRQGSSLDSGVYGLARDSGSQDLTSIDEIPPTLASFEVVGNLS